MLWLVIAMLAAGCTSMTTILAKMGIKDVNSNFATAFRTGIVILCSLVLCLITGNIKTIGTLNFENYLFLILSGLATGCSWLCYYRALKLGDINKVAPIDKSSFILTSILFLIFFFNSTTNNGDPLTIVMLIVAMLLMLLGTFLMIAKRPGENKVSKKWLIYAILSAVFASAVALFVKLGLKGIASDVGTLIRTMVVLVFAWAIVLGRKDYQGTRKISPKSWIFLALSGLATGGAWLLEYYALNMEGVNPIAVNSIGKLSILLTMLFSFVILKEKFSKKSLWGLALLTAGIVIIIIFSL